MSEISKGTIFARHTKRADGSLGYDQQPAEQVSPDYPSITIEGEREARELARQNFVPMIDQTAPGAILFIGGSSEEDRTKATAEVIGDELAEHYTEEDSVIIYRRGEIKRNEVEKNISENPDKKIVFIYPLYLREFSLRPHHREPKTGEHTPFMKELLVKVDYDEERAIQEWFQSQDSRVPTPQQTAEQHLQGIKRLHNFASRFVKDRPIYIGIVGHGWQLDALAVYLANQGQVTVEAFNQLFQGRGLEQPESGQLVITEDGASFDYRGKRYNFHENL